MSTSLKLIIPLLDTRLSKIITTPKSGFINAFTYDINRPGLDNHIFLMYEFEAEHTKEMLTRSYILANLIKCKPYLHRINGKWVSIYALPITNGRARKYKITKYPFFSNEDILKIINFWGTSDKDVNEFITEQTKIIKFEENIIPEEDYVEEVTI